MTNKQTTTSANPYDEVPYISQAFASSQPYNISVIANLFGLATPKIETARILEIGCSFGGNIIPFAIANPEAELIGLDLAQVQVDEGNKIIKQLGLKNITLKQQDIADYKGEFGKFDYIICHGVFSWVPKFVQEKILDVVKSSLKEDGLAVISYNTNPGWKEISILRDMMLFRTEFLQKRGVKINSSEELVDYGKKAIDFLEKYSVIGKHLSSQVESIQTKTTHYIFHEYFEKYNEAFYLYDFNTMLEEKGLMHLSDSDLNKTLPIYNKNDINMEESLEHECRGDRIAKEQYYDYLCNQQFRSSIIGHKDKIKNIEVSKNIKINNLDNLHIRFKEVLLKQEDGNYKSSEHELSKEHEFIIDKLNKAFPNTISVKELYDIAKSEQIDKNQLYTQILSLIYNKYVESFITPIKTQIKTKPRLKPEWKKYLNYFLTNEQPMISLATFNGIIINIEKFQLQILLSLDGTKTKEDLINDVFRAKEQGEIVINNTTEHEEEIQAVKNFIDKTLLFAQKCYIIQ